MLNEHEEQFLKYFIRPDRIERYRLMMQNEEKRSSWLDKLNHCRDLNEKHLAWLESNAPIKELLIKQGAPRSCYLISAAVELDRKYMDLDEALELIPEDGWGTILSSIPGKLAYYYDEEGKRRGIFHRREIT